MLEAKDLICKVTRRQDVGSNTLMRNEEGSKEEVYVVPSMLPEGLPFPSVAIEWHVKYYLDFDTLLPDAVLFRLMARCSSHSELVCQSENQCVLFREGGIFTLGTQFFFMLRKQKPCPTQELVEVSVKAVPESNPIDVLRYLHNIMETLRCRDFPRLQYRVGIKCPHEEPHQSCRTPDMWHIIDLCGNGDTSFPEESQVHRLCHGRQIDVDIDTSIPANPIYMEEKPMVVNIQGNNNYVVIAGRNARVSIHREIDKNKQHQESSDHNGGNIYEIIPDSGEIDVYISSSPRDEGWLQENLVRYLTAPPHKLQVCTNLYDAPSHPNHVINMKEINICRVFLVVCTRNYMSDPTGRLRYEREVARQRQIQVIAVAINNAERPEDMFDTEFVSFSKNSDEMSSDTLLTKVQRILSAS
ncbi:uncharacterized protein [Amphiura filiformis]|uniref:uncharacterized protein n=1 Tax=Amphiura filiformis TaxID=82378 RepID=UPI003B21B496